MIDATRLPGVVGDRAAWATELVVEADAGREREQAGGDAGEQVARGASAVALEREQVLAGEEDRLDALADGSEVQPALRLVSAGRPHDERAELGDRSRELAARVAL